MTDAAISLSFPARQGYAIFLRTAVSGAAAAYDLPLDALEDLREAALEAFSALTESAEGLSWQPSGWDFQTGKNPWRISD